VIYNNDNKNSFLVPGDTGKLDTRTSIILVQNAHGINLAARWSNENKLNLMECRYVAKLLHECLFCYDL